MAARWVSSGFFFWLFFQNFNLCFTFINYFNSARALCAWWLFFPFFLLWFTLINYLNSARALCAYELFFFLITFAFLIAFA